MAGTESPFLDGKYHYGLSKKFQYAFSSPEKHKQKLQASYRFGFEMIAQRGWQTPLADTEPRVLQMGTASHHTSRAFIDFVHSKNPDAQITVMDISSYPLIECIVNDIHREPNTELQLADARQLDTIFPDNSFDLIETDGFFQFFPPSEKEAILRKCFVALRPGGILMTRESLLPTDDAQAQLEYKRFQTGLHIISGAMTYPLTRKEMWELFGKVGFSRTIAKSGGDEIRKLAFHIVAQKPEAKI